MTAEAVVMNRIGVALAADSAVTVGRGKKIYASSDKLFQLSTSAPIGVMIWGSADFVGIPWETIIKCFRNDLGTTRYDTTAEYAQRLRAYLGQNPAMFPRAVQDDCTESLVMSVLLYARRTLGRELDRQAEKRDGLQPEEIGPIAAAHLSKTVAGVRAREPLNEIEGSADRRIRRRYGAMIRRCREQVFGNLPLTAQAKRDIISVAVETLRRDHFGPMEGGVVVAGFGEKEFMPALHAVRVEEMVLGQPRVVVDVEEIVNNDDDARIRAFAQGEQVFTFLEGIDQRLEQFMQDSTRELFLGMMLTLLRAVEHGDGKLGKELRTALAPELPKMLQTLFTEWQKWRVDLWAPVLQMVSALPKDELAAMAEALVNLTKFRRRVTPEQETVGGPIDVAVITKGDGFVWVNRKHYFAPDLNPRMMARLRGEGYHG